MMVKSVDGDETYGNLTKDSVKEILCGNQRKGLGGDSMKVVVGQGSCGIATEAKKTAAEFEKQIAEKNLDIKVDVTGCVGTCYLEPIVDIYEDDGEMTRYVKVQPDKVEKIVEDHLVNHKVVEEQSISSEDEAVCSETAASGAQKLRYHKS